jgi:hypothetical protein
MVCIRAKSLSNFIACDGATASIAGFSRKIVFYKLPLGGRIELQRSRHFVFAWIMLVHFGKQLNKS